MTQRKNFLLILALIAVAGCNVLPKLDDVLPDKRTEYKKSDSLPDLEVPPDLTSSTINDSMAIPNEQATLSQIRRQRAPDAAPVAAGPDEQWVSVRRPRADLWPRLRTYFEGRGHPIEVDDAELGVLETGWGEPMTGAAGTQRVKYRVFSEPGATPDVTVLFISSQRQMQVQGEGDAVQWVDADPDAGAEKLVAGDLNTLLNGAGAAPAADVAPAAAAAAAPAAVAPQRPMPELREPEAGRMLLALPDEYSVAWPRTDKALQRGGFFIEGRDEAKGLFMISYFRAPEQEKKGWLSKMKFWDDEDEGQSYRISLTGVGMKTEMIVVNEDGEWDSSDDARRILTIIQSNYGVP
jgi:outer membrane protein assembly factor BamC